MTEGKKPFHVRLTGDHTGPNKRTTYKHNLNVLKRLVEHYPMRSGEYFTNANGKQTIGDHARDDRFNTSDAMANFMLNNWHGVDLDQAHADVCRAYEATNDGKRKAWRPRKTAQNDATTSDATSDGASETTATTETTGTTATTETTGTTETTETMRETSTSNASTTAARDKARASLGALGEQIADIVEETVKSYATGADVERIARKVASDAIKEFKANNDTGVTLVELKKADATDTTKLGVQHKQFPLLLKVCGARQRDGHGLNVWLSGPAGSGKTTAAANVAKALDLAFYFTSAIDQPYKLTGFVGSAGLYNSTAFRQAWEHGGLYLFDEVDASMPGAVMEFNAALANGSAAFPDRPEPVKRHPDCVIVAGANTNGAGATADYSARMKQDAAFRDRFVIIDWPIDEALERALCANKAWVDTVQNYRRKLARSGIRGHMISPRATQYGETLLAQEIDEPTVIDLVIRKGLSDQDWRAIEGA
jgi:cobaltochelatase CobS